jgi:crotonobetainyl-CoA:carnitine CoA-transferase CaiB-like acyl-CoA transferase
VLLSKYLVLDLTDDKGLFCTKILADLGADVLRIDKPVKTLPHGYKADQEKNWLHVAYNRNKRSVTLDIESGKGRIILKKLARKADVLVESFHPGYMDQLGIGYSHLRKVNPRLVMVSITPFGQTGPYRDFQACDMTLQAMGGIMAVTGPPDMPPTNVLP